MPPAKKSTPHPRRRPTKAVTAAVLDEETVGQLRRHHEVRDAILTTRAFAQAQVDAINAEMGQRALEQLALEDLLRAKGIDPNTVVPDVEG